MNRYQKALIITMEECGELTQACSKVLRHGFVEKKHIDSLYEEIGDVVAMIAILQQMYDIDPEMLDSYVSKRLDRMKRPEYL
jgi:NTP pyrophosphatase (non-canonical NTP hydrolase)